MLARLAYVQAVHPVDALLDARGSSKRWLAKKLLLEESTLNRYLYGKRKPPADFYERIADVLHVPVSFIKPPGEEPTAG
jgi:transcriptional regulator with XRE-family HTH domain